MAQNTDSPDRETDDHSTDESDDSMFTDSFAPRGELPDDAATDAGDDELSEIEDLLPKAGPVDGTAQLP